MLELKTYLSDCGYQGHCTNIVILRWALRTGACSYFFLELLDWIEAQLRNVNTAGHRKENTERIFVMLRQSIMMRPCAFTDRADNPREFRLKTLKILLRHLRLRKNEGHLEDSIKDDSPKKGNLKITLNMKQMSKSGDWNVRQVRCEQRPFGFAFN